MTADEGGLAVFRGIPFAQPPAAWDGVREAYEFGAAPPRSSVLAPAATPAGDDWLTVNVWSPAADPAIPAGPPMNPRERLTRVFDLPSLVTAYPEEASRRLW